VKLWKATVGLFVSVRLSVRREQRGSNLTDFHEIFSNIFSETSSFIKIRQPILHEKPMYICDSILLNSIIMRNDSDQICRDTFFFF